MLKSEPFIARYFEPACLGLFFLIPLNAFLSVRFELLLLLLALSILGRNLTGFFPFAWDALLYLGALLMGLIYTSQLTDGWRIIETHFSLLALPLIFYALARSKKLDGQRVLIAFVSGTVAASMLLLGHALIRFVQTRDTSVFLFYELTDFLRLQPTYFAYYLILSVSYCLHELWQVTRQSKKILYSILCFFLFAMLLLTGGRTASVGMLLILSYFLLLYLTEKKNPANHWQAAVCILLLSLLFTVNAYEQQIPDFLAHDGWQRVNLWSAAVKALPEFWFGAGTGDIQVVLNDYYRQAGLFEFADQNLNAHNQFLHTLIGGGVVGVLSLLLLMVRPLLRALRHRNSVLIIYFFPVWVYAISEVILGRYQGVVFFAFIYGFVNASCERGRELNQKSIASVSPQHEIK